MSDKNSTLVQAIGGERLWVLWQRRLKPKTGNEPAGTPVKYDKIPKRIDGSNGSSKDPSCWLTYKEAMDAKEKWNFSGIGVIFSNSGLVSQIVGVDFDYCLTEEGKIKQGMGVIGQFIAEAQSYTEISPSGRGLHVYFKLAPGQTVNLVHKRTPVSALKDFPAVEVYEDGRFFTVTNSPFQGLEYDLRTVTAEELIALLGILGYPWQSEEEKKQTEIAERRAAEGVPNEDYISPFDTDEKLIRAMFISRNGDSIRELYNGDISRYSDDASKADMAMCAHLAFWCGKNKERMRRIWLASPLGNRQKTQSRPDYQDRTLDAAINNCQEVYRSSAVFDDGEDYIRGGKDNVPILNVENVCRAIMRDQQMRTWFRYNEFTAMIQVQKNGEWTDISDVDFIEAQRYLSTHYTFLSKVQKAMVIDAITSIAAYNPAHPPREYVDTLKWDGVNRLEEWIFKTFPETEDDPAGVNRAIAAAFMMAIVKRIYSPGCQIDFVLVLEGAQGIGKTSALRVIGGEWFTENIQDDPSNKDFYMSLAKSILVEFSEGVILSRADARKIKGMISRQVDHFRPPYARSIVSHPRTCVFAMTTNDSEYLKDDTGNRRWLPVEAKGQSDLKWLKANRDQLFAEARVRVIENGEKFHEFPSEIVERQGSKNVEDEYSNLLKMYYFGKLTEEERWRGISAIDAFRNVWVNDPTGEKGKEMSTLTSRQITGMFRNVLHLVRKKRRVGEQTYNLWIPSQDTEKAKDQSDF